jgi:nucleoside 2-deoxyribosyltransferase
MRERIYIAGRFSRRYEFRRLAEDLEAAGHEITCRWLYSDDHHAQLQGSQPRAARAAERDLEDVRAATVCIAFTEGPDGKQGRGGRHVEVGAAIALGLRVIVVGNPEHIFHLLPEVEQVDTVDAAIASLTSLTAIAA